MLATKHSMMGRTADRIQTWAIDKGHGSQYARLWHTCDLMQMMSSQTARCICSLSTHVCRLLLVLLTGKGDILPSVPNFGCMQCNDHIYTWAPGPGVYIGIVVHCETLVLKSMDAHSTPCVPGQSWLDRAQTWAAQSWKAEYHIYGMLAQAAAGRWMHQAFKASCPI